MKILIFGGTTEGRELAEILTGCGHAVTVSCATELGVEELEKIPCKKLCGRLDVPGMEKLIPGYELVADATHPYAAEVSRNVAQVCAQAGIPLRRILRPEEKSAGCIRVSSCREAAEYLQDTDGNILITTGSKELAVFGILNMDRIFARVLPTHAALDTCEAMGLPHRNILCLQGPFTQKMNEAMLEQYNIRWMVTKSSGAAGGFAEKMQAAIACNTKVILVARPEDDGISLEEFLKEVNGK